MKTYLSTFLALAALSCNTGGAPNGDVDGAAGAGGSGGQGGSAGQGGSGGSAGAGGAMEDTGGAADTGGSGGSAGAGGMGGMGGGPAASCPDGAKTGSASGSTSEKTAGGLPFIVRTPPGYDPKVGSPLIVVYAECCMLSGAFMEMNTGLTPPAKERGYIIAYTNSPKPSSDAGVKDAATVPKLISDKWCIDPARIYLTGHSDGGTMAFSVPIFAPGVTRIGGIAPSAAGADTPAVMKTPCIDKRPLPTMILHSKNDGLFPVDWGRYQAKWSAMCNECDMTPTAPRADGCIQYPKCKNDVLTLYCEGSAAHAVWPKLNTSMLDFFDASRAPD